MNVITVSTTLTHHQLEIFAKDFTNVSFFLHLIRLNAVQNRRTCGLSLAKSFMLRIIVTEIKVKCAPDEKLETQTSVLYLLNVYENFSCNSINLQTSRTPTKSFSCHFIFFSNS